MSASDNSLLDNSLSVPKHVAIIMDGNGRWAKSRNLPRSIGHKKGADSISSVVRSCTKSQVKYLTLYAFSSENWNRSEGEIESLMDLLRFYLRNELKTLHKNDILIKFIGNRERLAADIKESMSQAEELTMNNRALTLIIALSYGGREEMSFAAKKIASEVMSGNLRVDDIKDDIFNKFLDTSDIPDPDLLIRTGGEKRLSNFLLWQCAYTELYFTDILWPDFGENEFNEAIQEFSRRERRYGKT